MLGPLPGTLLPYFHTYTSYAHFSIPRSNSSLCYIVEFVVPNQGITDLFGYLSSCFPEHKEDRTMSLASLNLQHPSYTRCSINVKQIKEWSLGLYESGWWKRPFCLSRLSFFPYLEYCAFNLSLWWVVLVIEELHYTSFLLPTYWWVIHCKLSCPFIICIRIANESGLMCKKQDLKYIPRANKQMGNICHRVSSIWLH